MAHAMGACMRNLFLASLLMACSSGGRGTNSNGGNNGSSTGSTTGSTTGSSTGGTTGSYNGPDMALPTLPFDSTVTESGAPNDAATHFGGAADPAAAPALVYPPDGVLVPPNLSVLE